MKDPIKKKKLKKILSIVIPPVLLIVIAIIVYNAGLNRNTERINQLKAIDGVTSVKEISQFSGIFDEKYIVTFEQPLDWSNPSVGTFPQRVEVAVNNDADINVMDTDGGCLPDVEKKLHLHFEKPTELVADFNGSYVHVEHRFFGKSRPADMSNTETEYWEYNTAENAANDYHYIYTSLRSVLGEKWISTGSGRGGMMTNVYAYYYPEDMLVYVPYAAPFPDGLDDSRFYDFIYLTVGDEAYGEEAGKDMRHVVTAFQVEAMKYKSELLPEYEKQISKSSYHFQDSVKTDVLYDLNVLEFAARIWEKGKYYEKAYGVIEMPENTDKKLEVKRKSVLALLLKVLDPQEWSTNSSNWPYYVDAATTYGQYRYNFFYLQKALEEEGLSDTLSVTQDMQTDFIRNMVFTPEQKEAFTYDGTFMNNLVSSLDTTTAKHLMIYGATDPWGSMGITNETENVIIYIHPRAGQNVLINSMPDELKTEVLDTLSEWTGVEYRQ